MNESDRQARITQLQNHRHALLQQRDRRGAPIASIDMELNVVRSELQALYETGRLQKLRTLTPRGRANQVRIA
ncbi:MAG: hypothetical protein M0Z43_01900 [Acidithiobacillus sp.]|jgi:hypothetical protein|nr:hypothetical protein [Acidithiobacillus sp.]